MRENWLGEMYDKIKQSRDARLSCILTLLGKKAANDADIAEALAMSFAGNDRAIAVCDYTMPHPISSTVKTVLIAAFAALYEHSPTLAAALARVVAWCWRGCRGA